MVLVTSSEACTALVDRVDKVDLVRMEDMVD